MRLEIVMLFIILAGPAKAQDQRGQAISDPGRLSGMWESSDGKGGAVGLHLLLTAKMDGAPTTLKGISQYLDQFVVGVYQRSGSQIRMGDESRFIVPSQEVHWDGRHLQVKHEPRTSADYEIEIDLTQAPDGESWAGLFHRGGFSKHVSLKRPTLMPTSLTPFAGTWSSVQLGRNRCVHLGAFADGRLVAWSDTLQIPGFIRYANNITPPRETIQYYGEMVQVSRGDNDAISLEFNAFAAICCSATAVVIPSKDGSKLLGNWQAGPNQFARPAIWKRVTVGQSCAAMN